jgi:hypothetical protein
MSTIVKNKVNRKLDADAGAKRFYTVRLIIRIQQENKMPCLHNQSIDLPRQDAVFWFA